MISQIRQIHHYLQNSVLRTPSFVQVQLVHGEIFLEDPMAMLSPLTLHCVTSSRQWDRSRSGMEWQGTRGFLELAGVKR